MSRGHEGTSSWPEASSELVLHEILLHQELQVPAKVPSASWLWGGPPGPGGWAPERLQVFCNNPGPLVYSPLPGLS